MCDQVNNFYDDYKKGNIVTNAKGGQSYHNYGLALDVVEVNGGYYGYSDNYPAERWDAIGRIGKSFGLEWGGDWRRPDRPHFQLNRGTIAQLLTLYNNNKKDSDGYILLT